MPLAVTHYTLSQVTLADFTRPALVLPHLCERDAAGIISELSQALQREGCLPDVLPFYHSALNQELLANSALPCGLAFPHARLACVKQLQFAFGRAPQPVVWGAKGSWPVQLVFLVAVPATDSLRYLPLLASLARLGQRSELLVELRAAENVETIVAVFEKIRMRQG